MINYLQHDRALNSLSNNGFVCKFWGPQKQYLKFNSKEFFQKSPKGKKMIQTHDSSYKNKVKVFHLDSSAPIAFKREHEEAVGKEDDCSQKISIDNKSHDFNKNF